VQVDGFRGGPEGVQAAVAVGSLADAPWVLDVRIVSRQPAGGRSTAFSAAGAAGVVRRVQSVTLEPGSYEAVVALAVRRSDGWIARVARQPIAVPRLPVEGLFAGPVILGEKAEPAAATTEYGPFVFGRNQLMPAVTRRFPQAGAVHVATRILGWTPDTAARPDLSVEYVFRQQVGSRWRFFNKTKPQILNASTLGSGFDRASRSVAAGMSVTLGAFTPGEFELDVRVHDNRAGTSVSQTARFAVY
jgi:hypothetical protein